MTKLGLRSTMAFAILAAGLAGCTAVGKFAPASDLDGLIARLEKSGALDAAVERGLKRQAEKEAEAQRKQQEEDERLQNEASKLARAVDTKRDNIFGDPGAEVSVIVYSDLECPYCKNFAGMPEQAVSRFDGKANVVFRFFPLPSHGEIAKRSAYYAECVGRQSGSKAFFAFTNSWFKLTKSNGEGLERGDVQMRELAQAAGVKDIASLDACARDPETAKLVADDIADGDHAGVNGTPGSIIRHNKTGASRIINGLVPSDTLEKTIRKALAN